MKKLYSVLFAILLICIAGTAVFLVFAPEQIPMHYNMAGEADRVGSKYESLIWPLLGAGMSVLFLLLARSQRKKGEQSNEKVVLIAGVCCLLLFTASNLFFMIKAFKYDPSGETPTAGGDWNRFVNICLGALLMALGNWMPKARRNALIGLRTHWSMANDTVWQKSQRFAGISAVTAGLCLILLSLFVPGMWNIAVLLAVITVWTILCAYASYRYYQADRMKKD